MLSLKIYGSSSNGNCFELKSDETKILLDCGLKNIEYDNIDGILLTHCHLDHTKGIKTLKDYYYGNYYSSKETLDTLPIIQQQKKYVDGGKIFDIKEFSIIPFEVYHDVKNFGYLIKHNPSGMKILYIIDTSNISNLHFKDIDVFIIEANHSWQWLQEKEEMDFKDYRTYGEQGHLDIESCIEFLQENINHNTKKIILTHISKGFSEYKQFEEIVKENIKEKDIEVHAINPKQKAPIEIILKEEIKGFEFN